MVNTSLHTTTHNHKPSSKKDDTAYLSWLDSQVNIGNTTGFLYDISSLFNTINFFDDIFSNSYEKFPINPDATEKKLNNDRSLYTPGSVYNYPTNNSLFDLQPYLSLLSFMAFQSILNQQTDTSQTPERSDTLDNNFDTSTRVEAEPFEESNSDADSPDSMNCGDMNAPDNTEVEPTEETPNESLIQNLMDFDTSAIYNSHRSNLPYNDFFEFLSFYLDIPPCLFRTPDNNLGRGGRTPSFYLPHQSETIDLGALIDAHIKANKKPTLDVPDTHSSTDRNSVLADALERAIGDNTRCCLTQELLSDLIKNGEQISAVVLEGGVINFYQSEPFKEWMGQYENCLPENRQQATEDQIIGEVIIGDRIRKTAEGQFGANHTLNQLIKNSDERCALSNQSLAEIYKNRGEVAAIQTINSEGKCIYTYLDKSSLESFMQSPEAGAEKEGNITFYKHPTLDNVRFVKRDILIAIPEE